MKKYLFLLQIPAFFTLSSSGQKIDTTACRMFESKLLVVQNYLKYKKTDSSLQTGDAVMILSLLTAYHLNRTVIMQGKHLPQQKIIEIGSAGMCLIKRSSIGMTN